MKTMILFKFLWIVNLLASLILIYFFFIGLADDSVSSRNILVWLVIISVFTGILFGSIWLKNHQQSGLAIASMLIVALPALCYLIFILVALFGNERMN